MGRGLASTESLDIDIKDMDFDDNQVINSLDVLFVIEHYAQETVQIKSLEYEKTPDLNHDGTVNALDITYVISAFGTEVGN